MWGSVNADYCCDQWDRREKDQQEPESMSKYSLAIVLTNILSVVDLSNIFLRFGSPVEYSRDLPPLLADYLFPLLLFVPEATDQVMSSLKSLKMVFRIYLHLAARCFLRFTLKQYLTFFQDKDIIDNNLIWFLNNILLRPNEQSEIVRSFQPWAFEEIFHISMIYFHLSSIMAVLRSFQGLLSSTFASFVSSTFLATWQYLGKHLHLRKLREKILFFGKTWIDLSTKRWKFLSHLFPESSCRLDGWLDHHGLRLLILRLHVAVVLRVAGPHHLQLGVARLVQTSHGRVVHLLTPGRVQPLTLQGVQRVGSPTISWRPIEASLWAGSRQRVLTFGVFVCNAIFFTSCRLLLLTEEGELFAEIRGAVFSKLVLDVVCVRLAPDPRAGKLKSATL